jgi:methylmalonyl-CoA mutase
MVDSDFANPFPPADEARWRAAVDKVLKGADFEAKLVSRTLDGIAIQPLEPRRANAAPVTGAQAGQPWRIAARVDHPDPEAAAELALADLAGGADTLHLVFEGAATARGFGLPTHDAASLDRALAGVELDLIGVRIDPAPQNRITARLFAEVVKARRLAPGDMAVDFGFDPIGLLARTGGLMVPWADAEQRLADMLAEFGAEESEPGHGFAGPFIACDARVIHEAGGSEAQELAYALAAAVAYMRGLTRCGVPLDVAERALSFTVAVDADQFAGIAKLRALRRLMARVQQACGLDAQPIRLHAETAWRMLTRLDTPVNMLRNAIATVAAGVGGADGVTVLPHASAHGLSDAFARRIARNTQNVLIAESQLWRVADPAAGAGSIEALTDALCAKAWDAFQEIEREGGVIASLQTGALQARIAATAARRARDVATGKAPLTGTSAYPNLAETTEATADTVLKVAPRPAKPGPRPALTVTPLPSLRTSEPFERLRGRADALRAAGREPGVFLATLGAPPSFAARASFAAALFATGGIEAVPFAGAAEPDGGTDLVALTDAFKASGARIACLCGADESYASEGVDAAMALAASGAAGIWLAGRPGEQEAALRAAGVGGFIFMGADIVAALDTALAQLEAT